MPKNKTEWEPKQTRIMDADKYTEWLRHYSLLSIIINFVEPLNPWKPGAQMPKNITEWEPKQTRIMDAESLTPASH